MKRKIDDWTLCRSRLIAGTPTEDERTLLILDALDDICALHKALMIYLGDDEDADYMTVSEKRAYARRVASVENQGG